MSNPCSACRALGVISYNVGTKTKSMRAHAMGFVGDFVVKHTDAGFPRDLPAGPATIRYDAIVKDGM